jgi:DNA-binding beta-propeller fold protein YncE
VRGCRSIASNYIFIHNKVGIRRRGRWTILDGQGESGPNASDNVYVTDVDNNRIQKFRSTGAFITKWGSEGEGDGQFQCLIGIVVDSSGNVYVTDIENHRIQVFSPSQF